MFKFKVALLFVLIFPPTHVCFLVAVRSEKCNIGILKRQPVRTYDAATNSAGGQRIKILLVARVFGNGDGRQGAAQDGLCKFEIPWQCPPTMICVPRYSVE